MQSGKFTPTADMKRMSEADALLICVPTPLGRHREPEANTENDERGVVRDEAMQADRDRRQNERRGEPDARAELLHEARAR